MDTRTALVNRLAPFGQEHLTAFWDRLDDVERERLRRQIESIDLELVTRLVQGRDDSPDWAKLAERALPPRAVRLDDPHNEFSSEQARRRGEDALRSGKVAMILVAGGQGTRLGFPYPKGLLPVGPISSRTLFEIQIDRLRAVSRRYGTAIPLYVMTSPATHEETETYFRTHDRCGLAADQLRLFCQGVMPAVDAATGKILLSEHGSPALNPDGHGGMLGALSDTGCLQEAMRRGIEHFFYGQIDNPLMQVCDPVLIGHHLLAASEMTTQVIAKRHPLDRVGNVVAADGRTQIIEYSDLPEPAARRRNADGSLYFWAGSIAVHVFRAAFLSGMAARRNELPFHRAYKKVPYVDASGRRVEPQSPNAIKFERFIFDLLPAATNPIVVEGAPEEVFSPVKNAAGAPSETLAIAQASMAARDRAMLCEAGVLVASEVTVEVNPRWALDSQEVARRLPAGYAVLEPTYFAE